MNRLLLLGSLALLLPLRALADTCGDCHHRAADRPPHLALTKKHADLRCSDCHRGLQGATTASVAHAKTAPDQLLNAAEVQASCSRCHVPGSVAGTSALGLGAKAYLDLGCPLCHAMVSAPSTVSIAPPLDAIGLRDRAYLEKVLKTPAAVFPKTPMPSFEHYFMQRPERGAALLVFLSSLRGTPRAAPKSGTEAACQSCHADVKKPIGAPHRCAFLHEDKAELSCARCHAGGVPESKAPCAYVERRAHECLVCHQVSGARGEGKDGT